MIKELWRVTKPYGNLILMQGNTPNIEHIHILPECRLADDFIKGGFVLVEK